MDNGNISYLKVDRYEQHKHSELMKQDPTKKRKNLLTKMKMQRVGGGQGIRCTVFVCPLFSRGL
jgi:hypothetical protein